MGILGRGEVEQGVLCGVPSLRQAFRRMGLGSVETELGGCSVWVWREESWLGTYLRISTAYSEKGAIHLNMSDTL